MRRLLRPELDAALAGHLNRLQKSANEGADVETLWKAERRKPSMIRIARVLGTVTGPRERCMYCEDSRGTDIEHFWPRQYRHRVFQWLNMLWVCTGCNRCKGNRFPCDASGAPLLIDPTAEDPWDYLFYDPQTDEITARWDRATGEENPKGRNTVALLATLRHQAITESRRRTRRSLQRTIRVFLHRIKVEEDDRPTCIEAFLEEISDFRDHGLAQWFFLREGREEPPFTDLRRELPDVWARITKLLA